MYTDITSAKSELLKRRKDPTLPNKVLNFLGGRLPEGQPENPPACIPRHIATCTNEDLVFAQMAQEIGLTPYWPEYLSDAFVTINKGKLGYVKLPFNNEHRKSVTIVDSIGELDKAKPSLESIITNRKDALGNNLTLPDFHHNLRKIILPEYADNYFDISVWHKYQAIRSGAMGNEKSLASYYYAATLSVYICHGVLFEDFEDGPNSQNLNKFKTDVLNPALQIIHETFGVLPIIVRIPYKDSYRFYPSKLLDVL